MATYALGRRPQFDERSRSFAAPVTRPVPSLVHHRTFGPRLNQGDLGACTGFATATAVNTHPNHRPRHLPKTAEDARSLYSRATAIDVFDGTWPPDDTGSSGLAACKAAVERGWIRRYEWAFGLDHALATLAVRPVMFGTNWYESMFDSDDDGLVVIAGVAVGGHEWCAIGYNRPARLVYAVNSWGPKWGDNGRFNVRFDDLARLLREDGDAVSPIV